MSDLIDRDALRLMKVKECAGHTIEYAEGWKACIEWIKTLPSAEPERKKGKWIKEDLSGYLTPGGNSIYHCSECGHTEGPWPHPRLTNFCPSCGADMRAKGNENV